MNRWSSHVPAIERALRSLWGVRGVKVDTGADDSISVRMLVLPERDPATTAREAGDAIARVSGMSVPLGAITVLSARDAGDDGRTRRKLTSLRTERTEDRFTAQVTLQLGGDVLVGESESPSVPRFEYRSIVKATLDGLAALLQGAVEVESLEVLQWGDTRLVVVSLAMGPDTLVGSALIRTDVHDAVARATLDALNRVITKTPAYPEAPQYQ